jgi:hypothetical protein
VNYFSSLFSTSYPSCNEELDSLFKPCMMNRNQLLCEIPKEAEIWHGTKDLNPT